VYAPGGGGGGDDDDGLSLGGSDDEEREIAHHLPDEPVADDAGDHSSWAMTASTCHTMGSPAAAERVAARRGMSITQARATARVQNKLVRVARESLEQVLARRENLNTPTS
jgi:hypothetical protein